jgi:hypothetical protein
MIRFPNAVTRTFRRISGDRCWKKAQSAVAANVEARKSGHEGVGVNAPLRMVHGGKNGFGSS